MKQVKDPAGIPVLRARFGRLKSVVSRLTDTQRGRWSDLLRDLEGEAELEVITRIDRSWIEILNIIINRPPHYWSARAISRELRKLDRFQHLSNRVLRCTMYSELARGIKKGLFAAVGRDRQRLYFNAERESPPAEFYLTHDTTATEV